MTLRHIISINDLSREEVEALFGLADRYLETLGDRQIPYRIAASASECSGAVMATLFYEPSTRTRLSFESAMLRVGGSAISSASPATSSAVKGETLADTIRIVSGYADLIVLRHPRDGAARLAAQYTSVPVINGGDGAREHPTQTLCDLYTLKRELHRLEGLNVAVLGDLQGGRTVHSLVYALARFGANILTMPAPGMELPAHVASRLREEFRYTMRSAAALPELSQLVSGIYAPRTAKPFASPAKIDVLYITRFQKERWKGGGVNYPRVNAEFLKAPAFADTLLMHPLPRTDELDPGFDVQDRAVYFRQASYGVPIRMAIITLLLNSGRKHSAQLLEDGLLQSQRAELDSGRMCSNENCITRFEESSTFGSLHAAGDAPHRLHCAYCDYKLIGI
ncbi:MAG: aspartate carbamoyltransferase [Alphaproteobacteria bacterium]|nr:aspartate carbamoyltransferase [Alphaproteobacteria bacterium]